MNLKHQNPDIQHQGICWQRWWWNTTRLFPLCMPQKRGWRLRTLQFRIL